MVVSECPSIHEERTSRHHHVDEEFLAKGTVYSIKSGDTLSKIAARSGTTVSELCTLNGLSRSSVLQIGQRIRVN